MLASTLGVEFDSDAAWNELYVRSDNGPEFIAINVREWLGRIGVKTLYIEPGVHGRTATARA
jgi:hypothetical protein